MKMCNTCKFRSIDRYSGPCSSCLNRDHWQPDVDLMLPDSPVVKKPEAVNAWLVEALGNARWRIANLSRAAVPYENPLDGPVLRELDAAIDAAKAALPVALTEEQIVDAIETAGFNLAYMDYDDNIRFARAIERAHGITAGDQGGARG